MLCDHGITDREGVAGLSYRTARLLTSKADLESEASIGAGRKDPRIAAHRCDSHENTSISQASIAHRSLVSPSRQTPAEGIHPR